MVEEQSNDKELLDLFKVALIPVEATKMSVGYLIKDNNYNDDEKVVLALCYYCTITIIE